MALKAQRKYFQGGNKLLISQELSASVLGRSFTYMQINIVIAREKIQQKQEEKKHFLGVLLFLLMTKRK